MKNTMIMFLAELFCPNRCVSCDEAGAVFCKCCKNYWKNLAPCGCLLCNSVLRNGVCDCNPGVRQFCLTYRVGAIKSLINRYKFESARCAGIVLAEMMAEILPHDCAIVPLPTIGRHVRERGFDHISLLAKKIALRNSCRVEALLERVANTVQVGADSETRKRQAAKAYRLVGSVDTERRYVLLDDVWTTGSSMRAAEKILRDGGARFVDYAVIAKSI